MGIAELFLIAVGLSMDAFAVAVCKGLSFKKVTIHKILYIGLWFGAFQALMPFAGYYLGVGFEGLINQYDHWIAFILLAFIGGNMIKESFSKDGECQDSSLSFKTMLTLAVATSIDALAVGITFAILPDVNVLLAVSLIGVITFVISSMGVKIGNIFGAKYKSKAELTGGVILILIGFKIFFEHLGIL